MLTMVLFLKQICLLKNSLLIDTRKDSVSAADIEYIAGKKLLLVPTFFKNKVVAYELSK